MKLVVGAPVCNRDWALPRWFECLREQTRPPDEYVFVVNDESGHTRRLLHELCPVPVPQLSYALDDTKYIPREERNQHPRKQVYSDFAFRRNLLRRMVLRREPDVFLSLDTDVMLEDPTVIERLLKLLERAPVVAPLLYLHAAGAESDCFNAGEWMAGDPGSPERAWRRVPADAVQSAREHTFPFPLTVDIPMAAVMMRFDVLESCCYHYHECGEDLGFAQDLDRHGHRTLWDPGIEARHVMSESAL